MTTARQTLPIRKVYAGMYDGPHATPKPSESGPIFLGIKNVGESGQLDLSEVRHISEEEYPHWIKRVEPQHGDIVFSYEATLNRYAIIPKGFRGCLGRRMALIRPDESKACGRYLYYYFFDQEWRNVIAQNTLIGSTVDRIPIAKFPDFPITVPSLAAQRKIAAILSAYDDLIENNLRRIKIMEEMAQNLYREWFVKFRFPGHQHTRFADSPLGKIPESWELKRLGEVASNFDRLRKPLSSLQRAKRKGIYPYYGAAKIFDYIDAYIFDGIYLLLAEDGSVITSDRKPVLQYVSGKFWPNNHTHILQGKGAITTEFLYMVLSEVDITGYVTGAAQPKITQENLNRIPVPVAEDSVLQKFNEFIRDIFRNKIALGEKNATLRRTRDLLLPKLISGEVDVSELDITVPEEVAA